MMIVIAMIMKKKDEYMTNANMKSKTLLLSSLSCKISKKKPKKS